MNDAPARKPVKKPQATRSELTVGKPFAHDSAELHVTGRAVYIDDMPEPEGLLHVAPGFARDASCGRITSLDLSAVEASPGVVKVLTAKDIPGRNDCSPSLGDDPIFAESDIVFHGQVVFAVVAETREAARRAARLARIVVDKSKPVVTADEAIRAGTKDVLPEYTFTRKDAAAAIAASPNSLLDSFLIGGQEHFYLEGQVSMALPDEKGGMIVHCSTQHPSEVQHCVARMLAVADGAVTCECRRMGGGFGGKESQAAQWACLAALAAHVTGRPAKCRLDRDDDMIMTGKRHDFRVGSEAGFDEDGRMHCGECGVRCTLRLLCRSQSGCE
jgi:xanthine dehydrogenase large subunit